MSVILCGEMCVCYVVWGDVCLLCCVCRCIYVVFVDVFMLCCVCRCIRVVCVDVFVLCGEMYICYVVSTPQVVLSDWDVLKAIEWRCCIIDEAHRLKNRNCKLLESLRLLNIVSDTVLPADLIAYVPSACVLQVLLLRRVQYCCQGVSN